MLLVPFGMTWAGYVLIFYGYCTIKGLNVGITDLIIPGSTRLTKVKSALDNSGGTVASMGATNNPPGMPANPPQNPGGPRAPDGTPLTPPDAKIA